MLIRLTVQFYWSTKRKGQFALSSLWVNSSGTATPWEDRRVVLSAKVNCHPWVTVHFAQGTSVFRNRFILGIHVHKPCTHSRLIYFKHVHEQTNIE